MTINWWIWWYLFFAQAHAQLSMKGLILYVLTSFVPWLKHGIRGRIIHPRVGMLMAISTPNWCSWIHDHPRISGDMNWPKFDHFYIWQWSTDLIKKTTIGRNMSFIPTDVVTSCVLTTHHHTYPHSQICSLNLLIYISLEFSTSHRFPIYPLVNISKTMENSTILHGKTHKISPGPFSIANC